MLTMALGDTDIQQLEACMTDLRPQGLLSATFDDEVAVCRAVRELETALETKDFFNLCELLLKVKGCCIPVKYGSEEKVSNDVSLKNRGKYAMDAVVVIDHVSPGGVAHRAGVGPGSAVVGTRGEEGQWLEPPRGNSSAEVLERFDEIAENSPEGVSIFVVK